MQHAIRFASKTHQKYQDQKRKGKYVPYIVHPMTVGLILVSAGAKEDLVIAGILHDTIEDSISEKKVTKKLIADRFGEKVADLVISVTEESKSLSWDERKAEALEHIKNFSRESLLLKSADVLANGTELIDDYSKRGEEVFKIFTVPKEKVLAGQINVIKTILKKWPKNPLAPDLKKITRGLQNLSN